MDRNRTKSANEQYSNSLVDNNSFQNRHSPSKSIQDYLPNLVVSASVSPTAFADFKLNDLFPRRQRHFLQQLKQQESQFISDHVIPSSLSAEKLRKEIKRGIILSLFHIV